MVRQVVLTKNQVFITWQRSDPKSCDLGDSHKRAGFLRSSRQATIFHINQLSFLYCTPSMLCFACVVFVVIAVQSRFALWCTLYFIWVFVLLQFPSHTSLQVNYFKSTAYTPTCLWCSTWSLVPLYIWHQLWSKRQEIHDLGFVALRCFRRHQASRSGMGRGVKRRLHISGHLRVSDCGIQYCTASKQSE